MQSVEWVRKRFYSNIESTPTGCWEWTRTRLPKGYGLFRVLGQKYAHRVSFMIHKMPVPNFNKLHVLHKCDNPPCVNPDHLMVGTNLDNVRDCVAKGRTKKGRHKSHCVHGHELSGDNIMQRPNGGTRSCRTCHKTQGALRFQRSKVKRGN